MKNLDIWQRVHEEGQRELLNATQKLIFRRGEVVYRQGDLPRGLYYIEEGLVGLVMTGEASGKEHLLRFFKTSQFFGHRTLFADGVYHATATALEKTVVSFIPKDPFLRIADQNPCLYKDVIQVLASELRTSEVRHVGIMENQVLIRTAQALVYLKDLYPEHNWTRKEIANFCASTTSTVIKAMAQLEERGLIAQDGRSIKVLERKGLIELEE